MSYLSRPALVARLSVQSLTHHVGTLLIVIGTTELVRLSRWHHSSTVERLVPLESVSNVLARRSLQCLLICGLQCCHGCSPRVSVARQRCGVVRALVVVRVPAKRRVETVDQIRALNGVLLEVVRTVGLLGVFPNDVQGLVAVVAREALPKTAASAAGRITATSSHGIIGRWRVGAIVAGTIVVSAECLFAVVGELGRRAAPADWTHGLSYTALGRRR